MCQDLDNCAISNSSKNWICPICLNRLSSDKDHKFNIEEWLDKNKDLMDDLVKSGD